MRKFFLGALLVAVFLALISIWLDRGTLYLNGKIDRDFVERIEKFPKSQLKTIVIDSPGGTYRDAIDAANLIFDNNIELVVDGKCYSACASILLASSTNVSIKSGSLIAFHNMVGFWHYFEEYLQNNEDFSIAGFQVYRDSDEVISIYKRSGINPDFFVALAAFHRINCIGVDRNPEGGDVTRLRMITEAELYIPNEALFRQFGWKFKEAHFPDEAELRAFLKEMDQERGTGVFAAEDPNYKFPQELVDAGLYIESVQFCDQGMNPSI
ncbi:hypothetical protein [Qipengyuania sp.]|uniref:hypothetical protein n=1 Tax=Qipengyuania sp. TaxID=2004515 RepID=UPI003AF9A94D